MAALQEKFDESRSEHISGIEWYRASIEKSNQLLHETIEQRNEAWDEAARLRTELHKPTALRKVWATVRLELGSVRDEQKRQAAELTSQFTSTLEAQMAKSQSELNRVNAEFSLKSAQDAEEKNALRSQIAELQSELVEANAQWAQAHEEVGALRAQLGQSQVEPQWAVSEVCPDVANATAPSLQLSLRPADLGPTPDRAIGAGSDRLHARRQGPDPPESLSPMSLVEIDGTVRCPRPPITRSQARSEMQWVSRTADGYNFCLRCSCPRTISPALEESSSTTHTSMPSFFHSNPFDHDFALKHYSMVHGDKFTCIEDMVLKYGVEGEPAPRDSRPLLGALTVY